MFVEVQDLRARLSLWLPCLRFAPSPATRERAGGEGSPYCRSSSANDGIPSGAAVKFFTFQEWA